MSKLHHPARRIRNVKRAANTSCWNYSGLTSIDFEAGVLVRELPRVMHINRLGCEPLGVDGLVGHGFVPVVTRRRRTYEVPTCLPLPLGEFIAS